MYDIAYIERDMAEKWRACVEISAEESILIKFDHFPAEQEMQIEAEKIVALRAEENQG